MWLKRKKNRGCGDWDSGRRRTKTQTVAIHRAPSRPFFNPDSDCCPKSAKTSPPPAETLIFVAPESAQHRHQLRPRLNPELPETRIQLRLDREHALAQPSRDRRAASGRATGSTFRAASPPYSSVNHKMTNRPSSRGSSPLRSARAYFTTFHRPRPHLLLSKEAGPGLRPILHAHLHIPRPTLGPPPVRASACAPRLSRVHCHT